MENENTNPAEEKDKKPEQDAPSESAENATEDAPEQTEENQHILLTVVGNIFFPENFDICFITLQNVLLQHFSFYSGNKSAEIILTATYHLVCHCCSAERISKAFPVLFLAIQRHCIHILLIYHP